MNYVLLLHLCAHFGVGNMLGAGTGLLTSMSGMDKAHPYVATVIRLGVPTLVGLAKELDDQEFSTPEFLATVAGGGLSLEYRF